MWHGHGEGDPLVSVDPVDTVAHHRWPDDTGVEATVEQTAVAKTAKNTVASTGAVATLLGLLLHDIAGTCY